MASRKDAATAEYEAFELVVRGIIAEPRRAWTVWNHGPRAPITDAWVGRYVASGDGGQDLVDGPELVLWSASGGMRCLVVEHDYRSLGAFGVGWAHRRRDGTWTLDEERRASWRWNNADPTHRHWEVGEQRPEQWVLVPQLESFRVVSDNHRFGAPFVWRRTEGPPLGFVGSA